MSKYQRPLRSDELMHWGSHKYIAKIGNRYFYTVEELNAFKKAGDDYTNNQKKADAARSKAIKYSNKVGELRYDKHDHKAANLYQHLEDRANAEEELASQKQQRALDKRNKIAGDDPNKYRRLIKAEANFDESRDAARSKNGGAKDRVSKALQSGKKRVEDFISKREKDRIKVTHDEAQIKDSSKEEKNPFMEAYERDRRKKSLKKQGISVRHNVRVR